MRRTRPKIAISENVTTGNINQRIVEVLQHDMDARESCKHLLVRFAVLCHGMPWGSDQALDVGNVNVKLYKIYIYMHVSHLRLFSQSPPTLAFPALPASVLSRSL